MNVIKEIIGRILMVGFTIFMLNVNWKLALITPPIIFKIFDMAFCRTNNIYNRTSRLYLDILTWASYIGYLVFSIILLNKNIANWYSWLIAIFIWLLFAQLLGFLWPMRWHNEKVDSNSYSNY